MNKKSRFVFNPPTEDQLKLRNEVAYWQHAEGCDFSVHKFGGKLWLMRQGPRRRGLLIEPITEEAAIRLWIRDVAPYDWEDRLLAAFKGGRR